MPSPGGQVSGMASRESRCGRAGWVTCGVPSTSRRGTTRLPVCEIVGGCVELMIVWTLYGHKTHPDNRK